MHYPSISPFLRRPSGRMVSIGWASGSQAWAAASRTAAWSSSVAAPRPGGGRGVAGPHRGRQAGGDVPRCRPAKPQRGPGPARGACRRGWAHSSYRRSAPADRCRPAGRGDRRAGRRDPDPGAWSARARSGTATPHTTEHLDGLYRHLERAGSTTGGPLAAKSVRHVHGTLHTALADAVERGHVTRNVSAHATPPRAHRKEMRVWSAEDPRAFVAHVRDDRPAAM